MTRNRLPKKHVNLIRELARKGLPTGMPRYVLAQQLKRELGSDVTLRTALDYINAAANEGILMRVGALYRSA